MTTWPTPRHKVSQDVEIKSSHIFPKVGQKVASHNWDLRIKRPKLWPDLNFWSLIILLRITFEPKFLLCRDEFCSCIFSPATCGWSFVGCRFMRSYHVRKNFANSINFLAHSNTHHHTTLTLHYIRLHSNGINCWSCIGYLLHLNKWIYLTFNGAYFGEEYLWRCFDRFAVIFHFSLTMQILMKNTGPCRLKKGPFPFPFIITVPY